MATSTTNLGLTKPSVNDAADIGVLNSNFDKIDAKIPAAGAAPSGYGLGLSDSTPLCTNANDAWQNGWFKIDSSTQNGIGVSAIMRVDARASAYSVCQTAYSTSWSSAYPVVRQRWCMNGTWDTEWSWHNPPMVLGTEYRTTERWNGKPVYTMMVDIGLLPNSSSKYASGVLPAGIYVTSIIGSAFSGYNSVPIQSNGIYVSAQGEWGTLYISTTSDYSAFNGYVTVKYTK